MAKAKVSIATENASYEDMVKILRSVKSSSATYIGKKDIETNFLSKKVKTGIPTIDFLSSGGLTRGRITIFAGNISSGKTTSTLQIVSAAQKQFKEDGLSRMCLWYDVEGAYDYGRANQLGVDQDLMIVKRGKVIEEVFAEVDDLISTGFIGFLVIDSLDALVARKVDDSDYGNTMGGASGAVAMHLPKLFNKIMDYDVTTIFIKQCREKMNAQNLPILTYSGGKALRHFADSTFVVNRQSNKNLDFTPIKIKAEKTRSSRMGLELSIPLIENGFDEIRDIVALAFEHDYLERSGSWILFDGEKYQGVDNFTSMLRSSPDIFKKLKDSVYKDIITPDSLLITSKTSDIILEDEED